MRSISVELELAACDDHGRSADLHPPDLVGGPICPGVQDRRAPDLGALPDFDLVAKADTGMACEMDRQRPRRRARGGILLNPQVGCEHPGLPAEPEPAKQLMPIPSSLSSAAESGCGPSAA